MALKANLKSIYGHETPFQKVIKEVSSQIDPIERLLELKNHYSGSRKQLLELIIHKCIDVWKTKMRLLDGRSNYFPKIDQEDDLINRFTFGRVIDVKKASGKNYAMVKFLNLFTNKQEWFNTTIKILPKKNAFVGAVLNKDEQYSEYWFNDYLNLPEINDVYFPER